MKRARLLFALALLLIPVGHGFKLFLGVKLWVDPTLILAVILFVLFKVRPRPWATVALVVLAWGSAYLGTFFLPPPGSELKGLYRTLEEPVRLAMSLALFWVCIRFFKEQKPYALKALSVSVLAQLVVAAYFYLVLNGILLAPDSLTDYLFDNYSNQVAYVGNTPMLRMSGTFFEPPPFGLFMFAALVIFTLAILRDRMDNTYIRLGLLGALAGTLFSLSQQVVMGLLPFLAGVTIALPGKKFLLRLAMVTCLWLPIPFIAQRVMLQRAEVAQLKGRFVSGTSGGERAFHTRFAWDLFTSSSRYWPMGIGPGRYGQYLAATAIFPDTETPQVTPVDWLVSYGIAGTVLVLLWLWAVYKKAVKAYGVLLGGSAFVGVAFADMFQANWINIAWFVALAYLFAAGEFQPPKPAAAKKEATSLRQPQPETPAPLVHARVRRTL